MRNLKSLLTVANREKPDFQMLYSGGQISNNFYHFLVYSLRKVS